MKKLILTLALVAFASFAHAAEPSTSLQKSLKELGIIYSSSETVALNGKVTKVWTFVTLVKNIPLPFLVEEGASLAQIKAGYLTACCVLFFIEESLQKKADPSPSPTPGGLKKLEI